MPSPPAPAEKPSTKGHRLPEDWTPTPGTVTWSQQQAQAAGLDITTEWAKFRDYWLSKPGAAGRKTDWDRTWRNWVRGAIERMPSWKRQQAGPAPLTNAQKRRQDGLSLLAQIAAEEETRRSASANRRAIQA